MFHCVQDHWKHSSRPWNRVFVYNRKKVTTTSGLREPFGKKTPQLLQSSVEMSSFVEGNMLSAKVVGYLHSILVKLWIMKHSDSFRPYFGTFSPHIKKPEVDFRQMKMELCSQRTPWPCCKKPHSNRTSNAFILNKTSSWGVKYPPPPVACARL